MQNLFSSRLSYIALGDHCKPVLVFLHGFLGTKADWLPILHSMSKDYYCIALDLPAHGESAVLSCQGFDDLSAQILVTLQDIIADKAYYLVGYSLGGRVAMYLGAKVKTAKIKGLIVESSHLGLDENLREQRLKNDQYWANRFCTEPLEKVLSAWYQQGVFASLTQEQKSQLQSIRLKAIASKDLNQNYSDGLARFLMASSLGYQPLFTKENFNQPLFYLCGAKDKKFTAIAINSGLEYKKVKKAGHNIHFEQPEFFIHTISNWLEKQEKYYG